MADWVKGFILGALWVLSMALAEGWRDPEPPIERVMWVETVK